MKTIPFPSLAISHWPEQDQFLWQKAKEPADLFDDDVHLAAGWRPATVQNREKGYSLSLGWLNLTGKLDRLEAPLDRVTRDRVAAFIAAYQPGRSELTVASTLRNIAYMLRTFSPPDGVTWLTKLAHHAINTAAPARSKLPRMARIKDLIALSDRLMTDGLASLQLGRRSGAQIYRDGLLIGFLASRPLRRCNLAQLRLGQTFLVGPDQIWIDIPAHHTKKGRAIQNTLPSRLLQPVKTYLSGARPVLLDDNGQDDGWLWIGRRGCPMPPNDITARVSKTTMKRLGRAVSPHLFRDCVATEVAIEDPAHIGITKSLLGHASLSSSQKYYNQATSFTAFARYEEVLQKMQGDGD